jgi:sensor histidine kinase YesM
MRHQKFYLNRYFWFTNVFFWLAVHAIFTHIQFGSGKATGSELSWAYTWFLMSPWFLSWIWVTAGVFFSVDLNNRIYRTPSKLFFANLLWMVGLLMCYWAFCSAARNIVRGEDLSNYWSVFTGVLSTSSLLDILIYLGTLAAVLSLRFYHKSVQESIELKRVQHELTQEQLKNLRSQLNPHFLFNVLNTIASLVRLKREQDAVFALSELSLMLRKILEHNNDSDVKIKDEVAFINSYLAIQKIRFADKLNTHICVNADCLELKIPNMILHPLVENAVQHGSQLESNQNPINVDISRDKNELKLVMTNKVAKDDTHKGFGIGLTNTRERLSKIYSHFVLELHPLKNGIFETHLTVPIAEQDA